MRRITKLQPQHLRVLALIADGFTNDQIATRLGISFFTSREYVKQIARVLGARNRANAVKIGYERGLLQVGDPS